MEQYEELQIRTVLDVVVNLGALPSTRVGASEVEHRKST